ncbi:isochorismatase family protein [Vibrio hannami]|uniref:isochorismatase family protein n=1 Tax=Vibrio hannami TaxID=2717094 RepID=UPI00240F3D0F|nr:isochorismatase family protein [Vibrio hannami]MDG3085355.1 isochorismatase family protein [Vibrio hannami]
MNDALLIIDMQNGCFNKTKYNEGEIRDRINLVAKNFRDNDKAVIFIQHNGSKEGYFYPGTDDHKIHEGLYVDKKDLIVEKEANDAFYNTNLDSLLKEKNISNLYVSGYATDFCVNATVHSALVKDYNLIVVSDCHTTKDRPQMEAKNIIDYHNSIWGTLTPTKGKVTVKQHNEILTYNDIRSTSQGAIQP